jgi:hypothetical protein
MTTTSLVTASPEPRSIFVAIWVRIFRVRKRLPPGLTYAQIKDAGIAWELAGYGRGADVSLLVLTKLESQR